MKKSYVRYIRNQDEMAGRHGLIISALKDPGFITIHPERYQNYYGADDFDEMDMHLESMAGEMASISDLLELLPLSFFEGGLNWVLTAAIVSAEGIKTHFYGFGGRQIVVDMPIGQIAECESHQLQPYFGNMRNAEISVGERQFKARFDAGGDIPELPDFEGADVIVSEYHKGELVCDFIITADKPIVVHQYVS